MNTQTTLRATSSADLLAIPTVLLGFPPRESCVVVGFQGSRVEFCARLDLAWLEKGTLPLAEQVRNARDNFPDSHLVVLGYSSDPSAAANAIVDFLAVLGDDHVREVLVCNEQRYWYVGFDGIEPAQGIEWELADCPLTAQAVFEGVNLTSDREAVVAEVAEPSEEALAEARPHIEAAERWDAELRDDEVLHQLKELLESPRPLGPTLAARLAVLLADEGVAAHVASLMTVESASRWRPRLAEARACAAGELAPNVVSVLGLACWLDGEGTQLTECLTQMDRIEPLHPLAQLLKRLHAAALPPSRW